MLEVEEPQPELLLNPALPMGHTQSGSLTGVLSPHRERPGSEMEQAAPRAYLGTRQGPQGKERRPSTTQGSGKCALLDPAKLFTAGEDTPWEMFINTVWRVAERWLGGESERQGETERERGGESENPVPRAQTGISISLEGAGERAATGRWGGVEWVGLGRGLRNWHCRSPKLFRVDISRDSWKSLGGGAHLPVYTPWGPPVSDLKPTFPRALRFWPSLSRPTLGPLPAPAGHLLAGELVDALDVVADASIDAVGLGCLVALPSVPRPG